MDSFDGIQDPNVHLEAFQTQVYISDQDDAISTKLFLDTLRGVAMQWFVVCHLELSIPLMICQWSLCQFTANHAKRLKFSDSFALRHPSSMGEIKARAEKHIEAKKDQADWIHAEKDTLITWNKGDCSHHTKDITTKE
ncbi:hypothetical protein CR513_25153, partial [Mucuna pruriens]